MLPIGALMLPANPEITQPNTRPRNELPPLRWPLELHLAIEAEREAAEVYAYQRGVNDARNAMQAALDDVLTGYTSHGLTEPPTGARDVIRRMASAMDRQARALTAIPGGRTTSRQPSRQREAA